MKCIYKISNDTNDFIYVGSTKDYESRKLYHIDDLKNKKHSNYKIQRDYNKGFVFQFSVIEEVKTDAELLKRKQYYIDLMKPKYNVLKIVYDSKERTKSVRSQKEMNTLFE